jgi:uncharacterized OsmC-like protein
MSSLAIPLSADRKKAKANLKKGDKVMSEELLVTQARSLTVSDLPGRSINSARTHYFVIDEPPHAGGPGEALTPAEAFLAGVSACGVLLVQSRARALGVTLRRAEATIEGIRQRSNPADFLSVRLRITVWGPTKEQAAALVDYYTSH